MEYTAAHQLARAIRESEEYKTYHSLKEIVMADDTQAALIREYRKLQTAIQMTVMSGMQADADDMQRFNGISSLLFSKPEVSQFLLAEMRMQQALGDIFRIVTEAADIEINLPGV
ncbi:MAG: YlbF family regulator [Clostridia bacterium]|nr:YlbF family regulator [Clostridia bacterium]